MPMIYRTAALAAVGIFVTYVWKCIFVAPHQNLESRALALLRSSPLIDGHNDFPAQIRVRHEYRIYDNVQFTFEHGMETETDGVKIKQGYLGGQFWSVWTECPSDNAGDAGPLDCSPAVRDTLEQIDIVKRLVNRYEQFEYCEESSCVEKAFQRRRLASMIGAEGLHQVGASIAVIRMLFDLGVRYITLTHNCNNPFATSATHVAAGGFDDGLTEVGEAAVLEMNRLGMMVDLSHVSVKTMEDALAVSRSPVLFSHSAARALSNHSRNVPDHILHQLRTNGGIVMITFVAPFLNAQYPQDATVETVVDHIYHVANEAGWKHVGIGSDFDGIADWPPGLNDTSCYPNLVRSLLRRGASDEQVKLVMGQNILRVWRENEQRSASLRSQALLPREDTVPGRYFGLRFG